MSMPVLRAEGVIISKDHKKILVQCDRDESFYRFPGGSIEWFETGSEAIARELIEEFDLVVNVKQLLIINESLIEYDGKKEHQCTLIHICDINKDQKPFLELIHNERKDVKLIWKSIEEIGEKPVYPEGILDIVKTQKYNVIHHNTVRKSY